MNFLQKKLWLAWQKFRFLRLPIEKRVRLEVEQDGRHLTFLLVSLYEAGYGVQVVGSPFVFRELICLRKSAPMPFVIGGKERECGISITDREEFSFQGSVFSQISDKHSPLVTRNPSHILLDYDYFSGLAAGGVSHGGTANTEAGVKLCNHETHDTRDTAHSPRARRMCRLGTNLSEAQRITRNEEAGLRSGSRADSAFSNPSTSELAQDPETTSPNSSAIGPTSSLATGHLPLVTAQKALRMPYFMQPGALQRGFHKLKSPDLGAGRRIRLGFYGTHNSIYYTEHFRFPILTRTAILERFIEKFSSNFQTVCHENVDHISAQIGVSLDHGRGDLVKKFFLNQSDYFRALESTDFLLCPPGWCMPPAHNIVECMSRGVIPILNYAVYMVPSLGHGVNCLSFSTLEEMERQVEKALQMQQPAIHELRKNVLRYYNEVLAPGAWWRSLLQKPEPIVLVNNEADSIALRDPDFMTAAADYIARDLFK